MLELLKPDDPDSSLYLSSAPFLVMEVPEDQLGFKEKSVNMSQRICYTRWFSAMSVIYIILPRCSQVSSCHFT